MGFLRSKSTLVLIGLVLLLGAALAGATKMLLDARERLGSTLARAEASEALLRDERAWNDRLRHEARASREKWDAASTEVQAALDAEPGWGGTPVPRSVRDGLCLRTACAAAPRGAVPAPDDQP